MAWALAKRQCRKQEDRSRPAKKCAHLTELARQREAEQRGREEVADRSLDRKFSRGV
jgi:hypothetical protein